MLLAVTALMVMAVATARTVSVGSLRSLFVNSGAHVQFMNELMSYICEAAPKSFPDPQMALWPDAEIMVRTRSLPRRTLRAAARPHDMP